MRPVAFRIKDFKSIKDSGVCTLSGDNITVLAGQNESGKTAVLCALRDFDLEPGALPETSEYLPEGNFDAHPNVAVQFDVETEVDTAVLRSSLDDSTLQGIDVLMRDHEPVWIERDLLTGKYRFEASLAASIPTEFAVVKNNKDASANEQTPPTDSSTFLTHEGLIALLRKTWPAFVYFDSFQDTLPREVAVAAIAPSPSQESSARISIPGPVQDFITLANVDLALVNQLGSQDKSLSNYLQLRGADITGDFLTYWQQRVDNQQSVHLQVRHQRDSAGSLKLAFYVHDTVDQYPEQRSRGFLWFLSFYLRLAAAQKRDPKRSRLLLVDEPGSYLHARAQRDVLHLFEDKLAKTELIVYSTHSPFLLPTSKLHRLRMVIKTNNQGTQVLDRLTHPALQTKEAADSLSPVIEAIGLDLRDAWQVAKHRNLLVEGMSDYLYITTWARQFRPQLLNEINVIPGRGASTLLTLASLLIGWGFQFAVLLDRDAEGNKTKDVLSRELLIPDSQLIQTNDAIAIEDVIAGDDFRKQLTEFGQDKALGQTESATTAIKRLHIDKILLARTFAERANDPAYFLSDESKRQVETLLDMISRATLSKAGPTDGSLTN